MTPAFETNHQVSILSSSEDPGSPRPCARGIILLVDENAGDLPMAYGGFDIDIDAGAGKVRLVLSGELDLAATDELRSVIQDHSEDAVILIDTTELAFIDSTGLGILVSARKQLGDRFQLIPGDATMRVLDLSGTKDYLLDSETTQTDDHLLE